MNNGHDRGKDKTLARRHKVHVHARARRTHVAAQKCRARGRAAFDHVELGEDAADQEAVLMLRPRASDQLPQQPVGRVAYGVVDDVVALDQDTVDDAGVVHRRPFARAVWALLALAPQHGLAHQGVCAQRR